MDHNAIITNLYAALRKRQDVRAIIPMGYVPGYPILKIKNDQLVAEVPFLRYRLTGDVDRTIVFPIKYVMDFVLPEQRLVFFADLAMFPRFASMNFNKGIGFFRHEAIKHLDRQGYAKLRQDTLAGLDKVAAMLIDGTQYSMDDDAALRKMLQMAVEPSLLGFYKALDSDFYKKYLERD